MRHEADYETGPFGLEKPKHESGRHCRPPSFVTIGSEFLKCVYICGIDENRILNTPILSQIYKHFRKFVKYVCLDLRIEENEFLHILEKMWTGMCV